MKKIIFLLPIFLLLFIACKSDDDATTTKGASVVKATIDGVEKTFNTINVVRSSMHSSETYLVTASINNNPNETFKFNIYAENPSNSHDFLYSIDYFKNNTTYSVRNQNDGNLIVTHFGDRAYKGNFSVNLFGGNNMQQVKITNASFEIYY